MAKILLSFLFFIHFIGSSQKVEVYINVQDSSITIGQPFDVSITAIRPFSSQLICPDTNSNLYPFEFHSLKTFDSKLVNDSIILDSAIYTLVSYKPYKTQDLQLKIGLLTQTDSITLNTNTIPLKLHSYIDSVYSDMRPKSYTPFYEYEQKNYNIILILVGVCLIITLCLLLFNFLTKAYKQKKINKLRGDFSALKTNYSSDEELQDFIKYWKQFIEQTTNNKITAMTTSEIKSIIPNEQIVETLTEIDNIKYNPNHQFRTTDTTTLIEYANKCLTTKIKELNEKS